MKKNDGGAAFPVAMSEQTSINKDFGPFQTGMSLRDYFAGMALQGICASEHTTHSVEQHKDHCVVAYSLADAMIVEREKK